MIIVLLALAGFSVMIAKGRGAENAWVWFFISLFLLGIGGLLLAMIYPFEGRHEAEALAKANLNKSEALQQAKLKKKIEEDAKLLKEFGDDR